MCFIYIFIFRVLKWISIKTIIEKKKLISQRKKYILINNIFKYLNFLKLIV